MGWDFNADLDPAFHFNADPDPAFHLNVDPDPAFLFNATLQGSILSLQASIVSVYSSQRLHLLSL
jgi:hypothetical protein